MIEYLFIGVVAIVFYAIACLLDGKLCNNGGRLSNPWVFMVCSAPMRILFLPLLFLLGDISLPSLEMLPLLMISILFTTFYFPLFIKSLQISDTSTVVALFSLTRVFLPVLSFFVLGEILSLWGYLGFGIIVFACIYIAVPPGSELKFLETLKKPGKVFWLMLCVTIMLSIGYVLQKYLLNHSMNWLTLFFWDNLIGSLLALFFYGRKSIREDVHIVLFKETKSRNMLFMNVIAGSLAEAFAFISISYVPLLYYRAIAAIQPFFILSIAFVTNKFIPNYWSESVTRTDLIRKAKGFFVIILGVYLVILT